MVPGVLGAILVLVPRADLVADGKEGWLVAAAAALAALAAAAVLVIVRRRRTGAEQPEVIDLRHPVPSFTRGARRS